MDSFVLLAAVNFFADPMVAAALVISIAVVALSYAMGEALSNPAIKGFGKVELRELGINAAIIAIIMVMLLPGGPFDLIGKGLAPPPPPNTQPDNPLGACEEWVKIHPYDSVTQQYDGNTAYASAGYFLGCRISGVWNALLLGVPYAASNVWDSGNGVLLPKLVGAYLEFMEFEVITGFLSSLNLGINLFQGQAFGLPIEVDMHGVLPFIFITPINEAHTLIVDITGTLVAATMTQKMLLDFIESTVPTLILPLGVLMRAFPFTRKTGSTVLCFGIVAYFIYPLSVLVNARIYDMLENPVCAAGEKIVGEACTLDSECCSRSCRKGECASPLTDFTEYQSTLAICQDTNKLATVDLASGKLQEIEDINKVNIKKLEEEKLQSAEKASKTNPRLKTGIEERKRVQQVKDDWKHDSLQVAELVLASPLNVGRWIFSGFSGGAAGLLEHITMDTAKHLVLIALFVVIEIVITLTLFKDFALLIGGEPRLMGITKLV